jgi:hypothetical protein
LFRTYVFYPQAQFIQPSLLIRKYDAEDILKLLELHDQELLKKTLFLCWMAQN